MDRRTFLLILLLALVVTVGSPDVALAAPCEVVTWIDVAGATSLDPAGVNVAPFAPLSLLVALTCAVETNVHLAFGTGVFAPSAAAARGSEDENCAPPPPPALPALTITVTIEAKTGRVIKCVAQLNKDPTVYDYDNVIKIVKTKAVPRALMETVFLVQGVEAPTGLPDVVFVGVIIAPDFVTGDVIFNAITSPSAVPDARSSVIRCFRQNIGQPHNCKTL